MKTKLTLIGIAAICSLAMYSNAQTAGTNAPANFFATAQDWLTSFNTNYTWTTTSFEACTGYKQVTGDNAANTLDAQYDFGGNHRWNIGASFQFSGIGSPINAEEVGAGYALVSHYDVKLDADLLGGYDQNEHSILIEPQVIIEKKMTSNTFTRIGVSFPEYLKKFNSTPEFKTEVGITF